MFTVNTPRKIAIRITIAAIIGLPGGCGENDRLRSEDVIFPDPALQACFEEILTTPSGKPYADEIELLRCTFSDIISLEGIEVLSGLKEISLRESPRLSMIEPVLYLALLARLDLANCELGPDSTQVLSKLEAPVRLNLSGNNIGDVSSYAEATSLVGLIAIGSNVTQGIADLVTLTNASELSFDGNPESPCADLETLRTALARPDILTPRASEVRPGIDCAP